MLLNCRCRSGKDRVGRVTWKISPLAHSYKQTSPPLGRTTASYRLSSHVAEQSRGRLRSYVKTQVEGSRDKTGTDSFPPAHQSASTTMSGEHATWLPMPSSQATAEHRDGKDFYNEEVSPDAWNSCYRDCVP